MNGDDLRALWAFFVVASGSIVLGMLLFFWITVVRAVVGN